MKNHQFWASHQKFYTLKELEAVVLIWIMSRHSTSFCSKSNQFGFVLSECQSNPIHFNRKSGLHNHILRSLNWTSDFPCPPNFSLDNVKSFPSNCFFFVTTKLKSSIKLPIKSFLLVVRPSKKDSFLGWVKSENDLKCSEISTFWLTSKFKPVFFHKSKDWFFQKRLQSKNLRF